MKKLLLLLIFVTTTLFSSPDHHTVEAGIMVGIVSSNGIFIKYNVTDNISLKGSGYYLLIDHNDTSYELKATAFYTLFGGGIGISFKFKVKPFRSI